jgi:(1->4)-alpha-D-glucan 1-alpha-D-glucosylmutase
MRAIECAKQKRPDIGAGLFDFLGEVLTLQVKGEQEAEFLLRFQQFTPPVMAKGVEDTAFYCYNRLAAMCEVGGDPASNGISVAEFHAYHAKMQATHPHTMTTLSTHDTKRSDDVRARLAVLSEMPAQFGAALNRWSRMNNELRAELFGGRYGDMPDRNTEYLLYQTLIGAWPITAERVQEYMLKAVREAKQRTSWTANNAEFEDALHKFIEAVLWHAEFVTDLERFVDEVKGPGQINSLAQTLMKYTAPGVPDLYQGSEVWDLSLVDPDNRRPVDYARRAKLLREIAGLPVAEAAAEAMRRAEEGLPKLWTIHQALCLRRERPESFGAQARYAPLKVDGSQAGHAIAYLRGEGVVTVVPRLVAQMGGGRLHGEWRQTVIELPQGLWTNRLTGAQVAGGKVAMEEALRDFPVALLVRE